jgi:phenylacetyl-CoA:acceptor oxidoreductase subunit 2
MISISPSLQHNWDWRAAGNFICGGTGSGLMVLAAASMWLGEQHAPWTALAALATVSIGLFLVWLEIGRPWRFANVFRNPKTSWMSREAWAGLLFFAFGAIGALILSPMLTSVAAAFGLIFLLCQAMMLRAARGIPLWREATIVPLILSTGLGEAAGVLLAATAVTGHPAPWLSMAVLMFVLIRAAGVLIYAWRLGGARAPAAAIPGLKAMTAGALIAGSLVPVALIFVHLANGNVVLAGVGGLFAAATGWWLKYLIVCKLAYTQGFAIEHTPARGAPSARTGVRPGWSH